MSGVDLDLQVPAGRLRAWSFGPQDGDLVLGIPGLTANSREFAAIAPAVAATGRRFVALDLRGRGHSDHTGPGTYGWDRHAADIVAAAQQLGADEFDLVGHSMGGFVGLQLAGATAPSPPAHALRRLVLVDALGSPDADALIPIVAALERLGRVSESADAHVAAARDGGAVKPWSQLWEEHYRYELTDAAEGGVISRTVRDAILEDASYPATHPPQALWDAVTMPTLLVRATVGLGPEGGGIVKADERDAFMASHPNAQLLEVDANHYGVIEHADTVAGITAFLGA